MNSCIIITGKATGWFQETSFLEKEDSLALTAIGPKFLRSFPCCVAAPRGMKIIPLHGRGAGVGYPQKERPTPKTTPSAPPERGFSREQEAFESLAEAAGFDSPAPVKVQHASDVQWILGLPGSYSPSSSPLYFILFLSPVVDACRWDSEFAHVRQPVFKNISQPAHQGRDFPLVSPD